MYREATPETARSGEFTAVAMLAPAAIGAALLALMTLFLGAELARVGPLRQLLLASSAAGVAWLVSVAARPSLSLRQAFARLPAWCWVAGFGLLTLAALAALSLLIAAYLVETSLTDPALATATLAIGVVVFWAALGLLRRDGAGPSRFSGPGSRD